MLFLFHLLTHTLDSDSLKLLHNRAQSPFQYQCWTGVVLLAKKETSSFQELGFYSLCCSGSYLIHCLFLGEPYF